MHMNRSHILHTTPKKIFSSWYVMLCARYSCRSTSDHFYRKTKYAASVCVLCNAHAHGLEFSPTADAESKNKNPSTYNYILIIVTINIIETRACLSGGEGMRLSRRCHLMSDSSKHLHKSFQINMSVGSFTVPSWRKRRLFLQIFEWFWTLI